MVYAFPCLRSTVVFASLLATGLAGCAVRRPDASNTTTTSAPGIAAEHSARETTAAGPEPLVSPGPAAPAIPMDATVPSSRGAPANASLKPGQFTIPVVYQTAAVEPVADTSGATVRVAAEDGVPISLVSVLQAVDREHPVVHVARHRVEEAYAAWSRAEALWLPSIRGGVNYNRHDGRIQDVVGTNIDTSRGALYAGLGAGAVGAGSPVIPGVFANVHTADAVFQPRIAGQTAQARQANAEVVTNEYLLQAALAYLELLRAAQDLAVTREVARVADELAQLTQAYAESGQGLAADYDRASTEVALRRNEVLRAQEATQVATARLAQLMRIDPTSRLLPLEPSLAPIRLFSGDESAQALVTTALMTRPEVRESRALVCEAMNRFQRERLAPLMPSVWLGISQGGFGAGLDDRIEKFGGRVDADLAAWWELRNLGLGDRAARGEMRSRLEQARWREVAMLDQIAREVVEAQARVNQRQQQLDLARQAVAVARSSYTRNLDRIRNGEGLPLEALQSVQALAQAQREYVRVIADYNAAQFTLHWAVGTLTVAPWDEPGGEPGQDAASETRAESLAVGRPAAS